jgi:hypothetical protein
LLRRTSFPLITDSKTNEEPKLSSDIVIENDEAIKLTTKSDLKSSKNAVGRIRRYSDNQNSSSTQNSKNTNNIGEFSSSLLELSKTGSSFLSTNHVSIRKHSSKPLKHRKTAKLLGIATFSFVATWIPYWIYLYLMKTNFCFNSRFFSASGNYLIFKCLKNSLYLNFVLNPVFYSFVDKRFRQNLSVLVKKLFDTFCCQSKNCFNANNKESNQKMTNNSSEIYSTNLKRNLSNASNKYYNSNNNKLKDLQIKNNSDLKKEAENNSYFFGLIPKNVVFLSENCSKNKKKSINLNLNSNTKTSRISNETAF